MGVIIGLWPTLSGIESTQPRDAVEMGVLEKRGLSSQSLTPRDKTLN